MRNVTSGSYGVLVVLALGCSQSFKPDVSTETGNPPVIDSRKIALVVTRDEVHVRGERGAIMPPEAEVEVTIVRTQDVTRDDVEDDGSFDVRVDATLDDVFEVRAVLGELRSEVVLVDRGGAMVVGGSGGASGMGGSGGMGGSLSCEEQSSLGRAELEEALARADRSCELDSDCMGFYRSTACFDECFGGFFSEAGLATLADAVQAIDEGVCSTYEDDGCELVVPPCVPPRAGSCDAGQCSEGTGGCESCVSDSITWRVVDAGVLPALPSAEVFTLSGCNTLERTLAACQTSVPRCAGAAGVASIDELLPLLGSAAVTEALTMGGNQGEPQQTGGYAHEITVGGETFVYRACAGVPGVTCLPDGPIQQLIDVLTRLAADNSCTSPSEAACSAPFQEGDCDAAIPVFWHDQASGACVQRIYGGCGGNSNRYASPADCQAACPPPASHSDCDTGRLLREICIECGPVGGCQTSSNVCARVCMNDADCASEPTGFGGSSFCNLTAGVCEQSTFCI